MKLLIRNIVVALMMVCSVAGCTNNGYIGVWYGQWAIDSYTIDGMAADIDLTRYYWKFQSKVVQIDFLSEMNEFFDSSGTWSEQEGYLILDFTHTRPGLDPEAPGYNPPAELGIPGREVTRMKILSATTSRAILSFVNARGQTQQYVLRKLK